MPSEVKTMPVCIRYTNGHRNTKDWYIANSLHHDGGVWVHDVELAKEFRDEAEARRFLARQNYDLPDDRTFYDDVIPDRTN